MQVAAAASTPAVVHFFPKYGGNPQNPQQPHNPTPIIPNPRRNKTQNPNPENQIPKPKSRNPKPKPCRRRQRRSDLVLTSCTIVLTSADEPSPAVLETGGAASNVAAGTKYTIAAQLELTSKDSVCSGTRVTISIPMQVIVPPYPEIYTLNPEPYTRNTKPEIRNPEPGTRNPMG